MELKFKISGLDCANCAVSLERAIEKVKGVNKVSISFMSEKMIIDLDEKSVMKDIENVIKEEEPDVIIKEI